MKPDVKAEPPKHAELFIVTTENGYIVNKPDAQRSNYGSITIASFESFASLTQWLKKNMVQR